MTSVLVVNDEPGTAELERRLLARAGHEVAIAPDRKAAYEAVSEQRPACVVLDLTAGGIGENLAVLDDVRASDDPSIAATPVVLIGHRSSVSVPSWEAGVDGFLARPFRADDLVHLVATVIARPESERLDRRQRLKFSQ